MSNYSLCIYFVSLMYLIKCVFSVIDLSSGIAIARGGSVKKTGDWATGERSTGMIKGT